MKPSRSKKGIQAINVGVPEEVGGEGIIELKCLLPQPFSNEINCYLLSAKYVFDGGTNLLTSDSLIESLQILKEDILGSVCILCGIILKKN